jgi:hypothetical protein
MLDLDKFYGHTHGPWHTSKREPRCIVNSGGDQWICKTYYAGTSPSPRFKGDYDDAMANARLIASAPELLAEVKRLREAIAIAKEFLEDRFDTVDGDDGQPAPNAEMRCHTDIQIALGVYP